MENHKYIGKGLKRVDGAEKVTGSARYAAEYNLPDLLYGVVISSPIAKGRISSIDQAAVKELPHFIKVYSHENVPALAFFNLSYIDMNAPPGKHFRYFQTNIISYSHQPVALVVANNFEAARYAAALLSIVYESDKGIETELKQHFSGARPNKGFKFGFKKAKQKGNFQKAFEAAPVQVSARYFHGAEHHNPMEMHASTVHYKEGGKLVIYDKTQGVFNSLKYVAGVFSLAFKDVKVISPFVGGAFGSGLRPQYQLFMAVLASLDLKRSVRVSLTREQMFSFGHRPATLQDISLGASLDGKLLALSHKAITETSRFEDYVESVVSNSAALYACDHIEQSHKVVPLDLYTPLDMRAPGGATGVFAIETAMDELAYKLGIDPLDLRLVNYSETDSGSGKPWSSKELIACYLQAADKFGWSNRSPAPGSMKEGPLLKGWGMATGLWDSHFIPGRVSAALQPDGKLIVASGTADIGTGTYTIMTQIAAETMGMAMDDVIFKLGDTDLPLALLEGGSATAGSIGTSVQKSCNMLKKKLFSAATKIKGNPFGGTSVEDVEFLNSCIVLRSDPAKKMSFPELMSAQTGEIKVVSTGLPSFQMLKHASATHSAVFVEVLIDEDLGAVVVSRVVTAVAAGKILNPKTARNQVAGGIVWGISMALQEDSHLDHHAGRFMNHSFGEYHIPVNADIHDIEIIFVEEDDTIINPLGVKGVGEIGIVGVAAAVLNAIFHATGKRHYELPVTLDQIIS